jgi:mono/diheme cytochrome c family protein
VNATAIMNASTQAQEAVLNSRIRMFVGVHFLAICSVAVVGVVTLSPVQARPVPQAGNVANGQKVFSAQKCESCHGMKGEGGAGDAGGPQIAPPPVALPMFIDTVRNPKDPMPAFSPKEVSDAELTDVYAFLKSMGAPAAPQPSPQSNGGQAGTGNAANGKKIYMSAGCYECHDIEGQGGAGTGPRLAPPMAYSGFIHQVRSPSDQMPPYTAKVLTDAEVSDIYAYLQSVPKAPPLASIPLLK